MSKKHYKKEETAEGKETSSRQGSQQRAPKENKPMTTTKSKGQARAAEGKEKVIGKKTSLWIALATTVLVVAAGVFHLIVRNSDMLFMAQSKDFFSTDPTHMAECMQQPGGLISWVATFLTQFFYYPALGASILIAIWVGSMWLSSLAFKVRWAWMAVLAVPAFCLLVSTIDVGYWIYYVKQTGYWFYGTVGYLVTMALVWFHSLFRKRLDRIITTCLIALTYAFFGWYTLLALVYIAVMAIVRPAKDENTILKILRPIFPLALAAVIPLLCYGLYSGIRLEDVWICGFPRFQNDTVTSVVPTIPFIIMAITPIVYPFLPKRKELKGSMAGVVWTVSALLWVGGFVWAEKSDFQNYNYHAEMRMYRAADEGDWEKVLDEMSEIPGDASRQMVLLKNVALLNTGEMGSKMFKYNNMGEPPTNGFDTLHVHMVQTVAPLLYYYHGKTNFTVRWCIENSVEFGTDYDNLKLLARCALVGGEMEAAQKYLTILKTTLFYKDWAERLWPITEKPELIKKYHEFDTVRELRDHMGTVLDGDNGLCEMYLLNYFSHTMNKDSKLLQELTLDYALVQKDIQLFWPRFFLYAQMHENEKMPVHYQEAAKLYGNLEPDNVDISKMPFDKEVNDSYQGFQQLSQSLLSSGMKAEDVGESIKSTYGGTFYWFYFFCRDIHSY
ncbi:MAG: hypothetical protein IKQ62_05255 [Bacteroidaceae bacterium]|nr:hypothetical protein [Bacteroidaceae bacterium]